MQTELISLRADAQDTYEKLSRCARALREGKLVVFPTETVYGLGADATNALAAAKIYAAKGRPSDNPLIIHIADPDDARKYIYMNETYQRLAQAFMPGPLTVVCESRDTVPLTTRGGLDTVAVRCPSHPVANLLIRLCDVAIAAPSANRSGSPSPTSARHVMEDMDGRVDMVIDAGPCDFGLESTIVKTEKDGTLTLLRPGKITVEQLETLAPVRIAQAVTASMRPGDVALSPGMKYRHYAPQTPLTLLSGGTQKILSYIRSECTADARVGVLCYREDLPAAREALPGATLYDFGARTDESAQAHILFYLLREADKECFDAIYAPLPEPKGIGLALYNRMIRAAAHRIVRL